MVWHFGGFFGGFAAVRIDGSESIIVLRFVTPGNEFVLLGRGAARCCA
jgi:hypothetical protein